MRALIAIATLALIIALTTVLPARGNENRSCREPTKAVQSLGIPWEAAHREVVRELHECGLVAVRLLVAELQVIDPESSDDPRWGHMVWCERALRSITGQEFLFESSEPLGRLSEFRGKGDRLGYVVEWMSHARVYVAPRDVQRKVIESWRTWLKKHERGFVVHPFGEWSW
jgi:hypothetical protein